MYTIDQFPPPDDFESVAVLKQLTAAHRYLAELNFTICFDDDATTNGKIGCPCGSKRPPQKLGKIAYMVIADDSAKIKR